MGQANENAPATGDGRGANQNHKLYSHCKPNLRILFNRLEHVRASGIFYRARCPVHQGKSKDSLKITPCDDGRILIHCFSQGCPPLEILQVCGLELVDLFHERLAHHIAPIEYKHLDEMSEKITAQGRKSDTLEPLITTMAATTQRSK